MFLLSFIHVGGPLFPVMTMIRSTFLIKTYDCSSALDEAAAALTRMRAEPAQDSGRSLVAACSEGDIGRVRRLLDEGRVSVHETTEEGECLLSLACSAGY